MMLEFALRLGVVYALIKTSISYGIWDSTENTQQVYNATTTCAAPYAEKARQCLGIPEPPPAPPTGRRGFLCVFYYNQAMLKFCDFLLECPNQLHQVLVQVPGAVHKIAAVAHEQYLKFEKQRALAKQEKEAKEAIAKQELEKNKKIISDRPLVQPFETRPSKPEQPAVAKEPCPKAPLPAPEPQRPKFGDEDIYKARPAPKRKCCCPKCKRKEEAESEKSKECSKCKQKAETETQNHKDCKMAAREPVEKAKCTKCTQSSK